MKVNHNTVRNFISYFGIGLFILAIYFKFKYMAKKLNGEIDELDALTNKPTGGDGEDDEPSAPTFDSSRKMGSSVTSLSESGNSYAQSPVTGANSSSN